MSLFCRHNRFTADCPICAKGTPLDPSPSRARRRKPGAGTARAKPAAAKRAPFSGPYVAGPARRGEDDVLRVVRLERVPGGVRLGEWEGAALRPRAPQLPAAELVDLLRAAGEVLDPIDADRLANALVTAHDPQSAASAGVSRGMAGDFQEELRIEAVGDGLVRVGLWVRRPVIGWELRDAPPMLPARRYAEAAADAVRRGVLAPEAEPADAS